MVGAEFDPQPFHFDEEAARYTIFGGLAASGWNQNDEAVQVIIATLVVPRPPDTGRRGDRQRD
jgi:acyl dehydratase